MTATDNILVPVITLSTLSTEINHAHRSVQHHAQSMLMEAKRAGEALLVAKKMVKHGEFKAWVKKHCQCSYPRARKYMLVAKHCSAKLIDPDHFDGGVDAFLEAHSTPRQAPPAPATPTFDRTDAEYALKLYRMVSSDNANEAQVAASKLDSMAKRHGMVGEEIVTKAKALLPDDHKSADQVETETKLKAAEARLAEVEARVRQMLTRKAEIKADLVKHTKDELLEMLADALLHMEQGTAA